MSFPTKSPKPPAMPEASLAADERTDHLAVIVPFMSGWTSQMKVYVPAASAGTW